MKFEEIYSIVGHVPFITKENGRYLYDLILREKLTNILELGIAHGTATCYMAAALHELGEGSVTAVDLLEDKRQPSAEEQIEKAGLSDFATVTRMQSGYTWFLHDEIKRNTVDDTCNEVYDLCIIDGPKNWTIDGAAFFFADKLLRQDAWIIFDDYGWSYSRVARRRDATDGITHRELSDDEQTIPHVKEIFELLVKQHPNYSNFSILADSDWAIAQKTASAEKTYSVIYREQTKDVFAKVLNKGLEKIKRKV